MLRKTEGYGDKSEEERPLLGFQAPAQKAVHSTRARLRYSYTGHRRPPPPKTTLVAVTMLVVGLVVVLLGIGHTWKGDNSRGGHHLLLGALMLLPGSWASLNILGCYLGWPGYDYATVPSYDD